MNRCGIDIVEIERIQKSRENTAFEQRIFAGSELELAEKNNRRPEFYAGRWAAKEAVAKALGCGFGKDCSPNEIEVLNNEAGAPVLKLNGRAKQTAERLNIISWSISITHEKHYAAAMVIAESADREATEK